MDRFLKRTEHPVSPVLPAPKKPKVSSKQGVISASTLKIRKSLTRLFLWKELSNVPHEVIFEQLIFTTKNYLIEEIRRTFPHISQIFSALEPHCSPNLPHTCRLLSSLRKVRHRSICKILPHFIFASETEST